MNWMHAARVGRIVIGALLHASCLPAQEPASWVQGLRVLAIRAEPPEVSLGERSHLTALVIDTAGRDVHVDWSECLLGPPQGQIIHRDCVLPDHADARQPVGSGLEIDVTLPDRVDAARLGSPDGGGGVYLPYVAHITAGDSTLSAIYRLRVGTSLSAPVNRNPTLRGIFTIEGSMEGGAPGEAQVLDAARPRAVHAGDALTLRADFTEDSAESYVVQEPRGNEPPLVHPIVETLSVSWFSTAGTIAASASGGQRPDVTLKFDAHLPASVALVDLWAVGRDERGGTSYLHRTLDFQ